MALALSIFLIITSIVMILLVLLHKGKGSGLSDLFGGGISSNYGGSSVVDDMNDLVDNLKKHNFKAELDIDVLPISNLESNVLIDKINTLLNKTNAAFRVTEENIDETLSNMLPIIILDGTILTAFGVPTLNDVIVEVENNL